MMTDDQGNAKNSLQSWGGIELKHERERERTLAWTKRDAPASEATEQGDPCPESLLQDLQAER